MSSDHAIRISGLSKHYLIFERPEDRLKQMLVPRLQRLLGVTPKRYFKPFAAVQDVSFEVKRGETVGIIGRNGSGKSTLLQIICGTLLPSAGTVDVNGRIAALLELGAGFNPEFTGRENVFVKASILGLSHAETEARFDDIARFADIGMFIDQPVKTYSSGMFVRLAFATAINVDPDILVVDEALAVGDEAFQRKCYARIEEIKSRGATILFVSHGAQTIVQLCDRALLMDRGELILEGRPKTVVSQYQRLVNASHAATPAIRESIIAMQGAPVTSDEPEQKAQREDSEPQFDPNLRSRSATFLEERGARICDVRIFSIDGRVANLLKRGGHYVLEYCVDVKIDVEQAGFGFGIRTTTGILVGGMHTSGARQAVVPHLTSGSKKKIQFEFTCRLSPGAYFVVCGVRGIVAGEEILVHRAIDVLLFRVMPERDLTVTGFVDLEAVNTISDL